ncbi:MAG: J domain-containing protein [Oscillospiraceae bacterium]
MDKLKAYSILELAAGATEDQIKEAYRTLVQQYSNMGEAGNSEKMNELNEAFDVAMGDARGAEPATSVPPTSYTNTQGSQQGRYASIRQLINEGRADEALSALAAIPNGANDAEWNFLMGSAYYYKGWLDQALLYFQNACRMDPANMEYQAALRSLNNSANGQMPGNPYPNQDSGAAAMDCACNTCTLMCCMDACCSMCRGM